MKNSSSVTTIQTINSQIYKILYAVVNFNFHPCFTFLGNYSYGRNYSSSLKLLKSGEKTCTEDGSGKGDLNFEMILNVIPLFEFQLKQT